MIKTFKKILQISMISALLLSFVSCQDPIFNEIRLEVELEEGTIFGDIYSIIRHKDKIYCSNGKIYSKDKDHEGHGGWKKINCPKGQVIKIAGDQTYLYALVFTTYEDQNDGEMALNTRKLYYSSDEGSTWENCDISITNHPYRETVLMCTNSVNTSNQKAFLVINNTGYSLNGQSVTAHPNANGKNSCASLNGSVKFFNGPAACSNNGDDTIYYASGNNLLKMESSGTTSTISSGIRNYITGIAVMNDSVLITSLSGAALVNLNGQEIQYANLSSSLSALYESRACLAVYPDKNAFENIVYASLCIEGTGSNSALFSHEGLWSFYPSRGKWNIE